MKTVTQVTKTKAGVDVSIASDAVAPLSYLSITVEGWLTVEEHVCARVQNDIFMSSKVTAHVGANEAIEVDSNDYDGLLALRDRLTYSNVAAGIRYIDNAPIATLMFMRLVDALRPLENKGYMVPPYDPAMRSDFTLRWLQAVYGDRLWTRNNRVNRDLQALCFLNENCHHLRYDLADDDHVRRLESHLNPTNN